ncbi:glycoside hydrolase family 28 protein [Neolentinus lepideus HHB14362 ss-1]|uniref:Glycoside hydrolase family 28 protein n=1 Tax=Neolentinus lepideus HHB14362 ss-1 TaxID=1314782 RepID=A0A165VW26_9AGAM|nr:glycoside hydrolase family 28 protein [Neolentinus lepideus HHB14362 ss-1]
MGVNALSLIQIVLSLCSVVHPWPGTVNKTGSICTVIPSVDGSDDTPAIISAFEQCGQDGSVTFINETYHIESVMQTTGLNNVTVHLYGTLLWGTDTGYWRNNSLQLGYQNQTTAWIFGGNNITFMGHGYGTFDGNGQIWYDLAQNESNMPGRPIGFTIANTTNSVFSGIRFVQSQFWSTAITHSENLLLEDIYINSTSTSRWGTSNTDGTDTFYSNNITFRRWSVTNGDDSIAPKANSSNLLIQDSTFYGGNGVAIGSIGQYLNAFEFIENVTAEGITCYDCQYLGYVKTWTGIQQGYPPNGGGGGLGYAKNIVFRDFVANNTRYAIAQITQCTSYVGATGGCDTSKFQISNITWGPGVGNTVTGYLAELQCSAAAPCQNITLVDGLNSVETNGTERLMTCSNVVDPTFGCTGSAE